MKERHDIMNNTNISKEHYISPLCDIYEKENDYVLRAEIPGVPKENLEINMDKGILEVRGKVEDENLLPSIRKDVAVIYRRAFKVSNDIESEKISATIKNGVLTVSLPKSEKLKPRKIKVEVS